MGLALPETQRSERARARPDRGAGRAPPAELGKPSGRTSATGCYCWLAWRVAGPASGDLFLQRGALARIHPPLGGGVRDVNATRSWTELAKRGGMSAHSRPGAAVNCDGSLAGTELIRAGNARNRGRFRNAPKRGLFAPWPRVGPVLRKPRSLGVGSRDRSDFGPAEFKARATAAAPAPKRSKAEPSR